ncbi:MAG TPA: ROK family protein [Chloroflexota bacterium]|nr:ROK family protein [Chloroflexota bacterium]
MAPTVPGSQPGGEPGREPGGAPCLQGLPRLASRPQLATEGTVLGIDVGGTNQTVALARLDGEVVASHRRRLAAGGKAEDVVANILEMIEAAISEVERTSERRGAEKVRRVGVGFGGLIDAKRGVVLRSHHVSGWDNYPLRELLEQRLNASAVIENDANAAALGEARFGAGRGHRNILYVNVGTGIGAGVILDGALYHGQHGTAGEVGHVTVVPEGPECACGKRGCLEALASGPSLARRAQEAARAQPGEAAPLLQLAEGDVSRISGPHVFAAAGNGDALAGRLVEETAAYLGLALGNAANVLDPSIIVVGGGMGESGEILFAPLRTAVRRHLLPSTPAPEVVPAALGYDAGIAGALALALEGL